MSGRRATDNDQGVPQGKYLVDDKGQLKYLVDPAINGIVKQRDNGTPVQKFDAPKTALMALLTEGILTQKLSWTLVLMGVAIALVLELSGVPSLPFAVGVYLPLSESTPIFVGGLMRYLADRAGRTSNGQRAFRGGKRDGPRRALVHRLHRGRGHRRRARRLLVVQRRDSAAIERVAVSPDGDRRGQTAPAAVRRRGRRRIGHQDSRELATAASRRSKTWRARSAKSTRTRLPPYIRVPRGTELTISAIRKPYKAEKDTTLGEIAREVEGSAAACRALADLE